MNRATTDEYVALLIATLVLVIVLISSYMCIQLYHLRKPAPPSCASGSREGFLGAFYYSPSCGSEWLGRRRAGCRGMTTGVMPAIETAGEFGDGPCDERLGGPARPHAPRQPFATGK